MLLPNSYGTVLVAARSRTTSWIGESVQYRVYPPMYWTNSKLVFHTDSTSLLKKDLRHDKPVVTACEAVEGENILRRFAAEKPKLWISVSAILLMTHPLLKLNVLAERSLEPMKIPSGFEGRREAFWRLTMEASFSDLTQIQYEYRPSSANGTSLILEYCDTRACHMTSYGLRAWTPGLVLVVIAIGSMNYFAKLSGLSIRIVIVS